MKFRILIMESIAPWIAFYQAEEDCVAVQLNHRLLIHADNYAAPDDFCVALLAPEPNSFCLTYMSLLEHELDSVCMPPLVPELDSICISPLVPELD